MFDYDIDSIPIDNINPSELVDDGEDDTMLDTDIDNIEDFEEDPDDLDDLREEFDIIYANEIGPPSDTYDKSPLVTLYNEEFDRITSSVNGMNTLSFSKPGMHKLRHIINY